jgi:Family of unknown function (DUF6492)
MNVSNEMNLPALVTPTYGRDLERCALLCESIDRYVTSFSRHYLVVIDEELPLFARFNSARREVLPLSLLLPSWLRPLPRYIRRQHRRYWWSLRARPVSGWHVQQLAKIAAANLLSEPRCCLLDSDVVFFRPFDMGRFAEPGPLPLLARPRAVAADAPLHADWIRSSHRLLGLGEPSFPAADYIGHIIIWDQQTVRAMIERIERASGRNWVEALVCARAISEYMLYGHFVAATPRFANEHRATEKELCLSYWDAAALDERAIEQMLHAAADHYVAFSAASFSGTPVEGLSAVLSRLDAAERRVA